MGKLLLIEDDQSFGYILTEYLKLNNFEVDWVKSGEAGLEKLAKHIYAIGILDIMLPGQSGFEVAQQIKASYPDFPFIFLTAKSLKIDKLKGYKLGADDYLTKPIDEELLVAKIKVLIKRTSPEQSDVIDYKIGAYHFSTSLQQLQFQEEIIKLTKRETELLQLLVSHQNRLLSRDKALRQIWGARDEFSRKSMDVFISHLRKYLAKDATVKIENIHGKGFVLVVE